jgi:diguanylate cyclase (GGDEF)-like protein
MPDAQFYLLEEPVCALDPLLLIPRIEYAQPIFSYIQAQPTPYSLVILDMKNFHIINDIFGYEVGDSVLLQFISTVRSQLPSGSKTMRFRHGDEFLFFLPMPKAAAQTLFDGIRSSCEQIEYPQLSSQGREKISFRHAVIDLNQPSRSYLDWLRAAEAHLRAVKGQGTLRSG